MSKVYRRNVVVDQQERVRRLRPYLPRESIYHRFGHLTLWRTYIIAMLRVHRYIVSPVTMFRVLWRTHFKNRRISEHGSSSHRLRHLHQRFVRLSISPWFIMTTFMFFLSIGYLCVGMYYLGVCAYVCVHMEVSHIFFI
jgi:hypothetical protein